MDEPQEVVAEAVAAPKPKRKGGGFKKVVLLVLLLFVIGGGGGWWFLSGSGASAEVQEGQIEERGVVPLETFLVNLTDPGGNRFLKVTLELVLASEAEAKHVADNAALMGHARSAILELLTEQNAQTLVTTEGKQKLKDNIKARVSEVLKKQKVLNVLFSEFVVQF